MGKPICSPCKKAICADLKRQKAKLEKFETDAAAADAVYSDNPVPPKGYHNATDAELADRNLTRDFIDHPVDKKTGKPTDFKASVFVKDGSNETIVAFRGSTLAKGDWAANAQQAMGNENFYYTRAQQIGKRIAETPSGTGTHFTGHSLGGGLASAASRATGLDATTFNAAGLHQNTVTDPNNAGFIDAVYVRGEALTTAQMIPGVSKAASNESWPLDPPPNFGVDVLTRAATVLGGIKGLVAAKTVRSLDLHRMKNVNESLTHRKNQVDKAIKKNNC